METKERRLAPALAALLAALALAALLALALPCAALATEDEEDSTSSYLEIDESSKTITVTDNDSTTTEIQDAINYIAKYYATGDSVGNWTIVVNAGTYNRFFISEKYATALEGLTVQAADGAEVVIGVFDDSETPTGVDGETLTYSSTPDVGGVYVNVTSVTLSGLTFQYGNSTAYNTWYASAVSTFNNQAGTVAEGLTISDCVFNGTGSKYGVMIAGISTWTVTGCTFNNLSAAISFMCDNRTVGTVNITDNVITNCDDAILESYYGGGEGTGTLTITGNTFSGTSSNYTTVCIMNEWSDYNSIGTLVLEDNTFEYVVILLDCIETTVEDIYEVNIIGEGTSAIVTQLGHGKTISDEDKVVTFTAGTSSGYWVLTSTDGISTNDLAYIQNLISEANASGATTLTIDMGELDLTGSSLNGYLSGGVKYLKTVLSWVSTTSVTVTKTWDDSDDADGIRPDSVTVELYADGEATGLTVTLSEDNGWTASFTGLDIHDDGGDAIAYTVVEASVAGYETTYSDVTGSATAGYTVAVTNTHEYATTSVAVSKMWDDSDDADGLRPDSVTVELYADGEATGLTVELSEENDWSASFDDLPAYSYDDEGAATEISYTVVEAEVDGYESAVAGSASEGYVVTNTHEATAAEEEESAEEEEASEPVLAATGDAAGAYAAGAAAMAAAALVVLVSRRRRTA